MNYYRYHSLSFLTFFAIILHSHQAHAQLTVSNIKPYQVIQRDSTSLTATFTDSGTCRNGTAKIQLRLQNQTDNSTVGSFSWKELSNLSVTGTRWKATIAELPAGGEYKAQFRALNNSGIATDSSQVIQNLLVGDIWLCAGQSNMQGAPGATVDAAHVHTRILWSAYPGTSETSSWGTIDTKGPSTSFANNLYALTKIPVGIIYAASGGTSLTDWFYAPGNNLFSSMSKFLKNGVAGWKIGGFLWYQGENEDQQDTWAQRYFVKFGRMRDSIRSLSNNKNLPVMVVQLESWDGIVQYPLDPYSRWIRWPVIRDQQELVGRADPYSACAPIWTAPGIHIDATGEALLGKYCAYTATRQFYGTITADPGAGPLFKNAWFEDSTRKSIVVQFEGVKGRLINPPDPGHLGFYVMKPSVFNINDSTIFDYGTDSYGKPAKMLKAISSIETSGTDKIIVRLAEAATDSVTIGYGRHIQLVSLSPLTDSSKIPVRTFFNRPINLKQPTSAAIAKVNTLQHNIALINGSVVHFDYHAGVVKPEIIVYRLDGKLLFHKRLTGNSIDLKSLHHNGMVLVKCKTGNNFVTMKAYIHK